MSEAEKKQVNLDPEEVNIAVPFAENFVYSNVSALSTSLMDVRISFGEALPDRRAYRRVGVVMPPEHAAQIAIELFRQLAYYETHFGEIRNPNWREFQNQAKADLDAALKANVEKNTPAS